MVEVIWTKKAFGQLERAVKYIRKEQGIGYAEIVLNASSSFQTFRQKGTLLF